MHWTVKGAIIALRCQQASSTWEQAACNSPHAQTRKA